MTADRGVRMRAVRTATAAAALLALPAAAQAAPEVADPPSPVDTALRAPVTGPVTVAGQMRAARRADEQQRLIRVAHRIGDRVARARGAQPARARLRGEAPSALRERIARLRGELREARRERAMARIPVPSQLNAIAACESGGDYATNTGNGFYGAYQFDLQTWQAVGGSGLPSDASRAEQDMRAARLYARAGAAPWPVCGR